MTHAINGTNGSETINGTSQDDYILAKAGNDFIIAGNGDDRVDAGSGNDTVNAGNGDDEVEGGSGDDTINGEAGSDELDGDDGNDTIDGGSGNDIIDGGDGNDILKGGSGWDLIKGGEGNDTITGGTGNDLIYGGRGTDTAIFAGNYASYDIFNLFGLVYINGQDGSDLALDIEFLKFDDGSYNVATKTFTPDAPPTPAVVSLTPATVTTTEGGALTFTFTRTGGNLAAPLTINYVVNDGPPLGGATRADGDFSYPSGMQQLTFAAGQTVATITVQTNQDATFEGDESFPVLLAGGVNYTVDPVNNGSTGVILNDDPADLTITGTPGNDDGVSNPALIGGAGNDTINALAGDDVLIGNGGNDVLNGDGGRDRMTGGAGNDTLNGGMDFDTAIYTDATEGIVVDFGAGTVTGGASVGSDTLTSTEGLRGTNFDDILNASTYSNTSPNGGGVGYVLPGGFGPQGNFAELEGNGGNDQITGNGNTRISYQHATGAVNVNLQTGIVTGDASVGTDTILGGVNAIRGSAFNDTLTGSFNLTGVENFEGAGGDDSINGNGGFDRVRYDFQTIAGPNGIVVNLAAGTVTGQDAAATAVIGSDTLLSIEAVRASNANDIYNAVGFSQTSSPNGGGDQGSFNEFEGMAGNDQIAGNGNTRLAHYSAQAGITVTVSGFTNPLSPGLGVSGTVSGDASIGTDTFTGVGSFRGSIFNDSFTGFDNSNTGFVEQFDGWAGDDTINGGGGLDRARYESNDGVAYGVPVTDGLLFDMDAGIVSGLNASATFSYGTDTLSSVEMIRGTNLHDVYDATGFSGSSANAGSQGTFNEFEGGGGDDHITGNGNTRISFANAAEGVIVNLLTGTVTGGASVGNDTIVGGVNQVRGSNWVDNITGTAGADVLEGQGSTDTLNGDAGNDRLLGGGGNDTIDGGANFDIAVYSGLRSEYTVTPGLNPGQSTVTDSVGGRDGVDGLTNVELIEFSNAYQMNQRNLDISPITNLVAGRQIIGTNNSNGDNLTIGLNGSGRTIDLAGGGTDTLILASSGFYSINLLNTEAVTSTTTGPTTLSLQSAVTNTSVTLGSAVNDVLTLAGGTNIVSVANVETINGGASTDTVTIGTGATTVTTVNNVENVFGSSGTDNIILTASPNPLINANLDLGGGTDSVALNIFGGATVNLALTDVETVTSVGGVSAVNLANAANGLDIDLGIGFQTLDLASTGNVVTVRNVETLNAFGSANDTVTFFKEVGVVNQTINLGFGTNVLNLAGADSSFSMFLSGGGNFTVNGQTDSGNENLNVLNLQGGTVFDLGAGANDVVSFANVNATPGVNVASVRNVEQVFGNLAESDQITVLGNASGTTTVTGGSGTDMMWASADTDHFRFASVGDSTNTVTGRDVVNDFDASEDAFVFDIPGATSLDWIETNVGGGNEVVLIDLNGDANYEMAIQLQNVTGPLTDDNFMLV